MNPDRVLSGTFWLMLAVQTIGSVDMPGKGPRKLPAPRVYVAAVVLWGLFHIASDIAPQARSAIAKLSGLVVLTALLLGPAGKALIGFLTTIAKNFGTAPAPTAGAGTGPGGAPPGPAGPGGALGAAVPLTIDTPQLV